MSLRWRQILPPSLHHLKRIAIKFDPLEPGTTGTKEFLFQTTNRKLQRTNPKCLVEHELLHDASPAFVELEYNTGPLVRLVTAGRSVDQILYEMSLMTAHLENTMGMGEEAELNEEEEEDSTKK